MAQAVECLPSKCKALSSNSSTAKRKGQKKKEAALASNYDPPFHGTQAVSS
jgi:hypothetical protein